MRAARSLAIALVLTVLAAPAAWARSALPNRTDAEFQAECLAVHNELRARHGAPPMAVDTNIAVYAKLRAALISQKDGLSHGHAGLRDHGENLSWWATTQRGQLGSCRRAVQSWYDEIKDYDFARPGFSGATGHFTQVVWKASTKLGCARVAGQGGKWFETYVVCNYKVPGNVQGDFPRNVLPPKG
ncbi:CAP family protein [Allokutzneria oryzae]|uniref:CAP family protein n=1 Tax=Allokutzneria oryzae TaxID=1378989 RepID=A0ABV5ZRL4_9PSEU